MPQMGLHMCAFHRSRNSTETGQYQLAAVARGLMCRGMGFLMVFGCMYHLFLKAVSLLYSFYAEIDPPWPKGRRVHTYHRATVV